MIFEIALIVLSVLIYWYKKSGSADSRNYAPGPLQLPYIGNLVQFGKLRPKTPSEIYEILSKEHGPVMSVKIGCLDLLVVHDYETMKEILNSDVWINRYFDDLFAERSFKKVLGIIFISGDVWKEMRRFSIRTLRDFGFGKQKSMEAFLTEEIVELMERVDSQIKGPENDTQISMKNFFTISVLNILWTMIAGYRFSPDDKRLARLLTLIDKMSRATAVGGNLVMAFPFLRHILPFTTVGKMRYTFFEEMHQFFSDILKERRLQGRFKDEQNDFVDVFMKEIDNRKNGNQQQNYYTDEQFIIVCFDLFVAGAETTSNTMEFAMLYMILNPHVQTKVQEEIDRIVGRSRLPSTLDRPSMPYTEATLLEVQRMAGVLPVIARSPNQDTKIGPYDVKEGTVAILNVYSMHHNEALWGDPEVFRPERFLDERTNVINANRILPFGAGKRVCLGEVLAKANMFVFFTCMLQRYNIAIPPSHPKPNSKPMSGFTHSPEPFHVVLKQR